MRRELRTSELTWVDVVNPTPRDMASLASEFHIHHLDALEMRRRAPRPKFEEHPGYLLLIVHVPVHQNTTRATIPVEVDMFVTRSHVITVHHGRAHALDDFFRSTSEDETRRERFVGRGAPYLLYSIMDRLLESSFPMLDHLAEKIEEASQNVFAGHERAMVREVSALRRDLAGFRSIIRPQVHLYDADTLHGEFATPLFKTVLRSISGKLARIWDTLETLDENIRDLSETNTALVSFKLNEFMKILTMFGAVFVPFGLIAQGMFVQGSSSGIPFLHLAIFWGIVALLLVADVVLFWYAKQRKLL